MDTVNKEWNIKVDFITFYKFSVTESSYPESSEPSGNTSENSEPFSTGDAAGTQVFLYTGTAMLSAMTAVFVLGKRIRH